MCPRKRFYSYYSNNLVKMKTKLFIFSVVCMLLFSGLVCAEKGGNAKNVTPPGLDDKIVGQAAKENKSTPALISADKPVKAQNKTAVLEQVRNRSAEHKLILEEKLSNVSNRDKLKVFQNQNQVREAVMNLLTLREAGNFSGGIGQNISVIAREFDNSVNKTVAAEEKIKQRTGLMRLLFGGDEKAANTLQAELNKNRVRLQQLERVQADLDPEYQPFFEEQLQLMEQEQTRLQELAWNETTERGLLGWLFK